MEQARTRYGKAGAHPGILISDHHHTRASGVARMPVVLALLFILCGCADLQLPDPLRTTWAKLQSGSPVLEPVRVVSVIRDESPADAAASQKDSAISTLDAKRGAATGIVVGGAGGAVAGVASCTPFLWGGPPLYGMCAVSGAMLGMLAGGVVGGIAGDVAARSRSGRNVDVILADLPPEAHLVDRLREQVLARARARSTLEMLDLGTLSATQMTQGMARDARNGGSILSLQIAAIRGERADDAHFRFTVLIRTQLGRSDGTGPLRQENYRHIGEPVANAVSHREALAAAVSTLNEAFEKAVTGIVEGQLMAAAAGSNKAAGPI